MLSRKRGAVNINFGYNGLYEKRGRRAGLRKRGRKWGYRGEEAEPQKLVETRKK